MKHFGDITKISGYDLPVVDIITGGSPCQDLSVAGKRAGLAGERSGLFMEQIRIVKEMRERDRKSGRTDWAVRPRYMVWENVPGAFSSNGGKDFQAVLEEIVGIVEDNVPDLSDAVQGKWTKAGCLYDEMGAWSIAWRVHDAQFWGVPQRRKRIALVADFGGLSAPEILFERKGVSRDSEPSGAPGQGATGGAEGGAGSTVYGIDHVITTGGNCTAQGPCFYEDVEAMLKAAGPHAVYSLQGSGETSNGSQGGDGYRKDVCYTLNAYDIHGIATSEPILLESNQNHATIQTDGISTALPASMGMGGGYVPMVAPLVFDARGNGNGETVPTMTGDHQDRVTDYTALCIHGEVAGTLDASYYKGCGERLGTERDVVCVGKSTYQDVTGALTPGAYPGSYNGQDAYNDMLIAAVDCQNSVDDQKTNGTLQSSAGHNLNSNNVCRIGSIVRRITPLECERLQGYPDGWTDIGEWTDSKGKRHKDADSPRYKALGNSIALPFWAWLARRICAQYERPMTMASLFDGIGGFPLVFSRAGAVPVWASEIEEFPIAVTKQHFPEVEE